jgi:hypothetical protein
VSCALIALLVLSAFPAAAKEEAVSISPGENGRALLDKPTSPKGSVILIPGGDGNMSIRADGTFSGLRGNQLVRSRASYVAQGLAVLTIDRDVNSAQAVQYMRKIAEPVAIVATSRGTLKAASAMAGAAKPDAVVLTAGFYDKVQQTVGSPDKLPRRLLVVHHRKDQCQHTLPILVEPFKQWGGAKVTVAWLDGGPGGMPACEARSYHGFQGLDGEVVGTVARFVLSSK